MKAKVSWIPQTSWQEKDDKSPLVTHPLLFSGAAESALKSFLAGGVGGALGTFVQCSSRLDDAACMHAVGILTIPKSSFLLDLLQR